MLYRKGDYERDFSERAASTVTLEKEPYRTAFRRDYARLIHSPSFRRLSGKTQLFPCVESDFFRNRLTHSLEVAQIAKSIARRLNNTEESLRSERLRLDEDLVEFAGLAHDLGHAPFGHNGEEALDQRMLAWGGFEGNAQTLRILSRLEKKRMGNCKPIGVDEKGKDHRNGLNLTYRSLASILKYDRQIPTRHENAEIVKGYYASEAPLVQRIKRHVLPARARNCEFKTVECQIMDLADDIAYSTYDLEDAFKAKFVTPLALISDRALLGQVSRLVSRTMGQDISPIRVMEIVIGKLPFSDLFKVDKGSQLEPQEPAYAAYIAGVANGSSKQISEAGFFRTEITSRLVGTFIRHVKFSLNKLVPPLSKVYFDNDIKLQVEVLKQFTYAILIMSARFKIAAYRGKEIVRRLFDVLSDTDNGGHMLLPDDYRIVFDRLKGEEKNAKRVVCDFIAGMTDRYAIEFYGRLVSENPQTIFKPL